jgi:hypothetical protein
MIKNTEMFAEWLHNNYEGIGENITLSDLYLDELKKKIKQLGDEK